MDDTPDCDSKDNLPVKLAILMLVIIGVPFLWKFGFQIFEILTWEFMKWKYPFLDWSW